MTEYKRFATILETLRQQFKQAFDLNRTHNLLPEPQQPGIHTDLTQTKQQSQQMHPSSPLSLLITDPLHFLESGPCKARINPCLIRWQIQPLVDFDLVRQILGDLVLGATQHEG